MNEIVKGQGARPLRPFRKAAQKPPMPANLEPVAEKARERHRKRHMNPGVAIEVQVEKVTELGYRIASPHSDTEAWQAMVCDALGTRSEATALTFLYQLTQLCEQAWHPTDEEGRGEWVPDECQLNMILNIVAGTKPKNEMQAALAAQMVAIHLTTMKAGEAALSRGGMDLRTAAILGKLARTFVMQMERMERSKGRKTTSQSIKVRHEKHVHQHQHVHVHRGEEESGGQPYATMEGRIVSNGGSGALPGSNTANGALPVSSSEGQASVPDARRRNRLRCAKGSR